MKLAIVRQTYNTYGGAERYVSRILNVLIKDNTFDITLITRQWDNVIGLKTVIIDPPFNSRIARDSGFITEAATYFKYFDIVQSHERIPGTTIFRAGDGVHATWLEQYSRILSPLTSWAQSFSRYHRYILQNETQMFTHPKLRKVICNSKMVYKDISRRFSLQKKMLTVIYNGVDTNYFSPQVRAQSQRAVLGIPREAPVLAYVGSGFSRKGVATALCAIKPYPDLWLVVAGWDKRMFQFKNLAHKLGVYSRVLFLGLVNDVRQVYGTADALILPTLYDPFPNVCIEALSCGLPLFTSYYCGAAEWIEEGKNGWVRDALDILGYQQAIASWLNGLEHGVNYSVSARATVEPYTMQRMAEEFKIVYLNLLS